MIMSSIIAYQLNISSLAFSLSNSSFAWENGLYLAVHTMQPEKPGDKSRSPQDLALLLCLATVDSFLLIYVMSVTTRLVGGRTRCWAEDPADMQTPTFGLSLSAPRIIDARRKTLCVRLAGSVQRAWIRSNGTDGGIEGL
ncbi:unnamed protein product [Chrysoparadoxa australica]